MANTFETNTINWIESQLSDTILQANLVQINENQSNGIAMVFTKNTETNIVTKKYFMITYSSETYSWFEIENYV